MVVRFLAPEDEVDTPHFYGEFEFPAAIHMPLGYTEQDHEISNLGNKLYDREDDCAVEQRFRFRDRRFFKRQGRGLLCKGEAHREGPEQRAAVADVAWSKAAPG